MILPSKAFQPGLAAWAEGGRPSRQNAWSHAVPGRGRRELSIADNPKDVDCRQTCRTVWNLLLSPHVLTFPFLTGSPQYTTAHREVFLYGFAIQNVSALPQRMDREGWGHNQQNTTVGLTSWRVLVTACGSLPKSHADAGAERASNAAGYVNAAK